MRDFELEGLMVTIDLKSEVFLMITIDLKSEVFPSAVDFLDPSFSDFFCLYRGGRILKTSGNQPLIEGLLSPQGQYISSNRLALERLGRLDSW